MRISTPDKAFENRVDISNAGEGSAPVDLTESPQDDAQWTRWLPDGSDMQKMAKLVKFAYVLFSVIDSSMATLSTGGGFGLLTLNRAGSQRAAIRCSQNREMVKEGLKQDWSFSPDLCILC